MVRREHPSSCFARAHPFKRRAFNLLELMVVIGILMLLLAMLIPSLSAAREGARRIQCMENLRQWGVAVHAYRHDHNDYLPMEGTYIGYGANRPGTWYNELPAYLDLPAYKDLDRIEDQIKELPDLHVWICPSKNPTSSFKSETGKNQFHYGMNQVLDGLGTARRPSRDTPGFLDQPAVHQSTHLWAKHPNTVFMFDIYPNSPAGTPRGVATMFQRSFRGARAPRFHGDYANILYVHGGVDHCTTPPSL